MWENTTPGTELTCDFCAGIGLQQLGVVLVSLIITIVVQFIVTISFPHCQGPNYHTPTIITMDLEDISGIRHRVEDVLQTCGGVDILINNAGKSYRGEAIHTSLAVDKMLMDVNYFAHIEVTRGVINIVDCIHLYVYL